MCMCEKPTINGQPGYSWDGKHIETRRVDPPELNERDTLLWDEPGRCGGLDGHSHHFRLVLERSFHVLLVKHGGGTERIQLPVTTRPMLANTDALDSNARYWLLYTLYSTHRDGRDRAGNERDIFWRTAASQKRIKTRKVRAGVKVWVEPPPAATARES